MEIEVGEVIRVRHPSDEILQYCKSELTVNNPEYIKKSRMGFWTGNTPQKVELYEQDGDELVLPYGTLNEVLSHKVDKVCTTFSPLTHVDFDGKVPLYDYQKTAVDAMRKAHYGILQSKAGSGKTQMGIALAAKIGVRTLWLTHTKDLLQQSKERAERYINADKLGTITEGKVRIGETITFATVQTMAHLDLSRYRDTWDCIIVDECHRIAGSLTSLTMFSKVLNNLRARHKYGLSATVHRADGMVKATFAQIGGVSYVVPDEAVADKVMTVTIHPVHTLTTINPDCLGTDGMVNYSRLINSLAEDEWRNSLIVNKLIADKVHYNLILSDRVGHLQTLYDELPEDLQKQACVIHGKMTSKKARAERSAAIEDMRCGENHFLFATYALCKEGLDIPRLDRLYLTTPQKDYAVIVQSVGRVARTFPNKGTPIVYDYVDSIRNLERAFKKRCTTYRKLGCEID